MQMFVNVARALNLGRAAAAPGTPTGDLGARPAEWRHTRGPTSRFPGRATIVSRSLDPGQAIRFVHTATILPPGNMSDTDVFRRTQEEVNT